MSNHREATAALQSLVIDAWQAGGGDFEYAAAHLVNEAGKDESLAGHMMWMGSWTLLHNHLEQIRSNAPATQEKLVTDGGDHPVWIRRQWNDYRRAKVRFEDLEEPHWDSISGGIQASTPQPFIHGYVWCNQLLEGELAHSCAHGAGPHHIKVCVVKKDNPTAVFSRLLEVTGPKPAR